MSDSRQKIDKYPASLIMYVGKQFLEEEDRFYQEMWHRHHLKWNAKDSKGRYIRKDVFALILQRYMLNLKKN